MKTAYVMGFGIAILLLSATCVLTIYYGSGAIRQLRAADATLGQSLKNLVTSVKDLDTWNVAQDERYSSQNKQIVILEEKVDTLKSNVSQLTLKTEVLRMMNEELSEDIAAINQTVVVTISKGHPTATPTENIGDKDKSIQNLSEPNDTWYENCYVTKSGNTVCFRKINQSEAKLSCHTNAEGNVLCYNPLYNKTLDQRCWSYSWRVQHQEMCNTD